MGDPSCARAHFELGDCLSGLGLKHFDAAVASYRTGVLMARYDDRMSSEELAEFLIDFALTLVHTPAKVTPINLRRVAEARGCIELACALAPKVASLRYDFALFLEE